MNHGQQTLLVIAYWFPPASDQTWRSFHLYRAFQSHFDKVKVISTSNRKYLPSQDFKGTACDVIAAPTLDYRTFTYFRKKEKAHTPEQKKPAWAFSIYNLLNSFPMNLLLGEGGLLYIMTGYIKASQLVKKEKLAVVFSTYRPYSDHAVAFLLKCKYPKLFWIADFRDLHLDPVLKETFFPRFQKWCTRKILAKADVVTTVSKGLAIHLRPFHPNVAVLRNGIGGLTYQSGLPTRPTVFTITYTGSMFRDLRNPEMLLEALSLLFAEQKISREKIQVRYAGKDTTTWLHLVEKHGLKDIFHSHGNVSHEAALQLQTSTHVNLLLTYSSPALRGNATGKLYEYLAAKQPILLLVNGSQDEELEDIFHKTNAGLIAYNSLDGKELVSEFLEVKYNEWLQTGKVKPVIQETALNSYRWENMTKVFLKEYYPNHKSNEAPTL